MSRSSCILALAGLLLALPARAEPLLPRLVAWQEALAAEGWLLRGQATFVEQGHPGFPSPYRGENSMQAKAMQRNTLSADLVVGRRLWSGAEFIIDPQISRGFGLSGTRGAAAFPNGEAFRTGSEGPATYMTRAFLRQTIALSGETVAGDDDPYRFAGPLPRERVTITAGKIAVFDIFDDNRYAHDPRTQFLNWAFVSAGAFDFANDAKGYTNGIAVEWEDGCWAVRAGAMQVAKRINTLSLDPKPLRGHQILLQADRFFDWSGRPGAVRLLGGWSQTRSQSYATLLGGDITQTESGPRGRGIGKAMLVLNGEQELAEALGAFARLSWNDGRTQQWMYTEMDWAASAGLVIGGARWGQPADAVGLAGNVAGLSDGHRRFVAAGGAGFIIGDGRLRYRPEVALEGYYAWGMAAGTVLTADAQLNLNPAYNADRGPIPVLALRLRSSF
ncbi:carbohydrate porin [Belnapia sp. T6]|uniref:Carbohydrate porin n=1 Tax=Belnapia mucosa TaxID=2804532 RepID=A0ABS1V9P4_9PROT|nr:carbohydrate porin [Belnapia mucosa]MBL6457058.1 carbohydrate porin [Belnapia mucosa]